MLTTPSDYIEQINITTDELLLLDLITQFCRLHYNTEHGLIFDLIQKARPIASKRNLEKNLLIFDTYIAFHKWHSGETETTKKIIDEIRPSLLKKGLLAEYGLSIIIITLIEWSKGNVETCFNLINDASETIQKYPNNADAQIRLHWLRGVIYFDLNELELSLEHYKNVLKNKFVSFEDISLNNYTKVGIASIYSKTNKLDKAKKLFEETKNISEKFNMWMIEARSLHELSLINLKKDELKIATAQITRSLEIRKKHNATPAIVSSLITLSDILFKDEKWIEAIDILIEADKICSNKSLLPKKAIVAKKLCEIYELQQSFDKAFHYLKTYNSINEDLKQSNSNSLQFLQVKYQMIKALKEKEIKNRMNIELQYAYNTILEQKDKIEKQNEEKAILLKEIHHRVKNNLQIITSLLSLQSLEFNDEALKKLYKSSQLRIKSMALIHEMLYKSENLSTIDYHNYLEELIHSLLSTYTNPDLDISVNFDADSIQLELDIAIPLGLIINEIITNSLKYAFKGRSNGEINVSFKVKKNTYELSIGDNGVGFDPSKQKNNSLGTKLISNLTMQFNGKLTQSNGVGTSYCIIIPCQP